LDLGWFGTISFDWQFLSDFFSIVVVNLILSGDNAVVIAMAVRSLPKEKKNKGIFFGAGAAVVLRIILTFFVAQLLQISLIKLIGGILILWIAVKLLVEGSPEQADRQASTLTQAMKLILMADITMSVDNMLAVAAASHGNFFLLLFGLGSSIPFVLFTSNLLSMLMDRYPIILWLGAAVLGRVAGEMIMTDPFVVNLLSPTELQQYTVQAVLAIGVVVVGRLWVKWGRKSQGVV